MTFEKHLRSVSSAAAQRLGIMRKSWQVFHDRSLLLRFFWSFVLPASEYCSAVWCSAADSHLKLLDRVARSAGFLAGGILDYNLAHRRSVAELCMIFKIKSNPIFLPTQYISRYQYLDILGVRFDSKLTFEKHLRSVSRAASQRLGILRKSWHVFHDRCSS